MASDAACRDLAQKVQEADKRKTKRAKIMGGVVATPERIREVVAVTRRILRRMAGVEFLIGAVDGDVGIGLGGRGCREVQVECPSKTKLHPRKSAEMITISNLTDRRHR